MNMYIQNKLLKRNELCVSYMKTSGHIELNTFHFIICATIIRPASFMFYFILILHTADLITALIMRDAIYAKNNIDL